MRAIFLSVTLGMCGAALAVILYLVVMLFWSKNLADRYGAGSFALSVRGGIVWWLFLSLLLAMLAYWLRMRAARQ